jgi:hypothetical protein
LLIPILVLASASAAEAQDCSGRRGTGGPKVLVYHPSSLREVYRAANSTVLAMNAKPGSDIKITAVRCSEGRSEDDFRDDDAERVNTLFQTQVILESWAEDGAGEPADIGHAVIPVTVSSPQIGVFVEEVAPAAIGAHFGQGSAWAAQVILSLGIMLIEKTLRFEDIGDADGFTRATKGLRYIRSGVRELREVTDGNLEIYQEELVNFAVCGAQAVQDEIGRSKHANTQPLVAEDVVPGFDCPDNR